MTSSPYPLGPYAQAKGVNFAFYAPRAKQVELSLPAAGKILPVKNKTGEVWHLFVDGLKPPVKYLYLVDGVPVLDPFAPDRESSHDWGRGSAGYSLLSHAIFDWEGVEPPRLKKEELIVYEMHVRGFTRDPSSHVKHPGKFLGLLEKIPYLLQLGINAVELMPIHEFDETENPLINPITKERLYNYWGYSPVNFFSIMNRYGVTETENELKMLVRELHRLGIEVILDVVYNHTSIKESHPCFLIAPETYYQKNGEEFNNDTGCGNSLRADHVVVQELVLRSLKRLAHEFHIDGFRFDLATVLKGDFGGLVEAIGDDPVLKNCKLIAEPWDMVHYEVGRFYTKNGRWTEWNDQYRDTVRAFIKGDPGKKGEFATRLSGSQDLYGSWGTPQSSLNFVTAHDGFSLHDLVSYNQKHNLANGENNRDGLNHNLSWNCGHEGPTTSKKINELRERQIMNFLLALFLSRGIPMLLMGDEYGHTKMGNNNTWCQDNALSWFDWSLLDERKPLLDFVKKLIRIRKEEKALTDPAFLKNSDIDWHGAIPFEPHWDREDNFIAFTLKGSLWAAFNATPLPRDITLPDGNWKTLIHTAPSSPSPNHKHFRMEPFSALLMKAAL